MNGIDTFKASNGVVVEMWHTADGCALKVDHETLVLLTPAQRLMLARWLVSGRYVQPRPVVVVRKELMDGDNER